MKIRYYSILFVILLVFSCSQQAEVDLNLNDTNGTIDTITAVDTTTINIPEFTPPEDGKITEEMADKYILCAKGIHNLIKEKAQEGKNYLDSVGITIDNLSDSSFIANNKEVIEQYNLITSGVNFLEQEKSIYIETNMSEDEFIWIASHLSDTENEAIQQRIAEELSEIIVP